MIYMVTAWVFLALSLFICIGFNHPKLNENEWFSLKSHRTFCIIVFLAGCIVRLTALNVLPYGLTAEEALVAVHGKSIWQTGHCFDCTSVTTQLQQWYGENTGPFLAFITAPFVGIFGINSWTARLPLVILSILAMLAMYGIGSELGGKRAGRYSLMIGSLCPYFILASRLTASANAALYLLPIALCALLKGMKQKRWLYLGMVLLACLAYTHDLYFFIAPVLIIVGMIIIYVYGNVKKHSFIAGFVGIVLVIPAVLTAIINLTGGESFLLLGIIEIPAIKGFDKIDWLGARMAKSMNPTGEITSQFWHAVFTGSIMQHVAHENINRSMLEPDGFYVLYTISFPLMLLGVLILLRQSKMVRKNGSIQLVIAGGIITAVAILFFGNVGPVNLSGPTYCYDYSSLFLYDALLMTAGFIRMDQKSRKGTCMLLGMVGINFALLCVFIFGGEYSAAMNVSFPDYREASIEANRVQERTGLTVCITNEVYPHTSPDEAAYYLYLASIDADMTNKKDFITFYPEKDGELNPDKIYIVRSIDAGIWDLEGFEYEEYNKYAVVWPRQ